MTDHIHVLYIDDDPIILDIAKQFLELTGGYTVTPIDNAATAIDLHSEKPFDAIVSDYEMEQMNGIELLKHLRAKGDTTPFIIFTGKGREEVVIEALNSGADFYLQKGGQPSVQFAELSNKIQYAVSRRCAERELFESQKKTTDIIEFLPDATFAINTDGVVIAWNRAMEEMTGISKEEMIGQGDHTFMIPFYGTRRHSLLYLIDHDEEDLISEYEFVHRQGNTLYAETFATGLFGGKGAHIWITGAPLFDVHGNRIGAIESIRDITHRKLTENELLRKNEELNAAYEEIAAAEEELRVHLEEVTRQEELVRKSEEQFQSLYMNMIDGAALHTLMYTNQGIPEDYVIVKINHAFETLLGISSEMVIGKTSREAYGVSDPPYLDIYAHVVLTGKPEIFETFFPPINKYFSISVYCPFKGSFATIFEDITPRKLAEKELLKKNEELSGAYEEIAATEEELRSHLYEVIRQETILRIHEKRLVMAQEIGQTGCWELDLATGTIWGSDEAFRIIAIPQTVDGFISLEEVESVIPDRKRVHQALIDLISGISEYDLEYLIQPADDSAPRVVHSVARLETDEQGNQKVMGISQDVTRRKETEELLRQTNAYLENLISVANVPIIVWDPSFRITRLNYAFEHLIGRSGDEVIGNPLEFLFPPDQAERSMRLFRTTQDGVRWETVEIDILHRDGSLRTLLWNSATLYSSDGITPVATIAQGHDITEERRHEQAKDFALIQIQKNLAQLAILNDEIRNPLTIITMSTERIHDSQVSDLIIEQAGRIDGMVNQLDRRWMESEKVLNILRKHYQIQAVQPKLQVSEETSPASVSNKEILIEEVQAQLYTILDSIDALVYVTDMDTYDILFMNYRGRSLFGDIAGQKCYHSIHGYTSGPCTFCTNHRLIDEFGPTGVYQWEYQNPKTGRWYDCRDRAIRWTDGRFVRLEIATDISERIENEVKIRQSEEKFSSVFAINPDPSLITNVESGLIVDANPSFSTWSGYTKEELNGKSTQGLNFWAKSDERDEIISLLRIDGTVLNKEVSIRRKSGEIRICRFSAKFITIGGVKHLFTQAHDVTDTLLAMEALKESEEKYRLLHENAGIGIGYYTPDGTVISYNLVAAGHMGGYPEDFNGKSIFELFRKEDAERYHDRILKAAGSDESVVYEDMVPLPTENKYFLSTFTRISDSAGNVVGIQIISQDITERKHAEETLHRDQARLEAAMAIGNIAWWEMELPDGSIRFHERKATILGYLPSQFHHYSNFTTLLHPDDYHKAMRAMHEHLEGNARSYDVEYRIRTATGSYRWFHDIGGITERDSEDKPVKVSGMVIDITDRRQALESLREREELLKTVISNLQGVVFSVDKEGVFLLSEGRSLSELDLLPGQVVGQSVFDVYRDIPEILTGITSVFDGNTWSGNVKVGNIFFDTVISPVFDNLQNVHGAVGIATDVTERIQTEETQLFLLRADYLKTGDDFFRSLARYLAETLHMDYVCIDRLEGDMLSAHTVAVYYDGEFEPNVSYTLHDTPCGEVVGKRICIFSHDVRHLFSKDLVLQEMKAESYVGTTLWGFDGKPIGLIAIIGRKPLINTHLAESLLNLVAVRAAGELERTLTEDALRESEDRHRAIVSALPDTIFIMDKMGVFLDCQTKNPSLLLAPPEVFIGKSVSDVVPQLIADKLVIAISKTLETGDLKIFDYYLDLPIGRKWFEMRIVRSTPDTVMAILRDITGRKLAEEAFRESNQKLRLLTGLTRHDIFNQVTAVQLFVDLALDSSNLPKIHEYISRVRQAGDQIEKTIGFTREFEDFGTSSSGWQQIYQIIESAKGEVSPGSATIENQIQTDLQVYVDPIIRKVFSTLMENAIRHGGKINNLRFFCLDQEESLIITCEDDGIGIPSEEKERIFDHGYGKHTGIGLFLAREILSITGLSIRECGIPGEGARFEILVPAGKFRMNLDIPDVYGGKP